MVEINLQGPDGNAYALMAYAKSFGRIMWEEDKRWSHSHNIGNGATSGIAMWFISGRYLHKLVKMGLLKHGRRLHRRLHGADWDYGYYITSKGKEKLKEMQ